MSSKRVPVTKFQNGERVVVGEADVFEDGTVEIKLIKPLSADILKHLNGVGLGLSVLGSYEKQGT